MIVSLLAQAADAAQTLAVPYEPLWRTLLTHSLSILIVFIFLTAIVTVIIQQRRKDKCLKLMHDYHVSYTDAAGRVVWGDLIVYSKGLELVFDAPYRTRRGVVKTSTLIYEKDVEQCLAVCRSVDALSSREKTMRRGQIQDSFQPGLIRRAMRSMRNLVNTLRDAFSKALTAVIGHISKRVAGPTGTSQQGAVNQIGQTLLGATANAYEPILERHIGKPVVLQLACPGGTDPGVSGEPGVIEPRVIDLPGYLADYSDKYVAVFNVEHEPISDDTLDVAESIQRTGYFVKLHDGRATITCTGPELLVVKSIRTASRYAEPNVVLVHGASIDVSLDGGDRITLRLERTRRADIVCPRSRAAVLFGGGSDAGVQPADKQHGLAPEPRVEDASDDPA